MEKPPPYEPPPTYVPPPFDAATIMKAMEAELDWCDNAQTVKRRVQRRQSFHGPAVSAERKNGTTKSSLKMWDHCSVCI